MKYVTHSLNLNQTTFTQEQIDFLSSSHFINRIEEHLTIVSSIKIINLAEQTPPRVLLQLEIYYNNNKFDTMEFDLHDYEYEEIIDLAKNIRDNEFLLQEIDNFLGGDIVE